MRKGTAVTLLVRDLPLGNERNISPLSIEQFLLGPGQTPYLIFTQIKKACSIETSNLSQSNRSAPPKSTLLIRCGIGFGSSLTQEILSFNSTSYL